MIKREAEKAIKWIKQYVEKAGAKGIVIGNSGGKDSATVLAMATKAIGKEKVIAVSMPCYSNKNDFEDAKLVADTFGVTFLTVNLSDCYQQMEEEIHLAFNKIGIEGLSKEATINMKPRLRMTTLYGMAQTLDYLVIGTGNLCESMVGYTTKWGDSAALGQPDEEGHHRPGEGADAGLHYHPGRAEEAGGDGRGVHKALQDRHGEPVGRRDPHYPGYGGELLL